MNKNPLRKIVGTTVKKFEPPLEPIVTDDGIIEGFTYELLECGHLGKSVLGREEWFGAGLAQRRRCAECGKSLSPAR